MSLPRILITPGEPAGVGPDITVQIAQKKWPAELAVIADPALLKQRAKQNDLPLQLIECDFSQPPQVHRPGTLKIMPIFLSSPSEAGQLNPANANYVIHTLQVAATQCMQNKAQALVTAPVHKGIINEAGITFTGHTEFLADYCQVSHTVMLFVVDQLKIALATTHLPLADVPRAITKKHLQSSLVILHQDLKQRFGIANPRILVCGLNPHAGEGGYLGREEIDIIEPALKKLREKEQIQVEGPFSADIIFTPKYLQKADAILAMYHDQALPLVKYIGFDRAVNVTLGLPFIRTAVDHGTALDIAGSKQVDPGSMMAAIKLAIELTH